MFKLSSDIVVIGAGVAGLQTAIYTASEGFSTILIERSNVGGQIRQTPRLENIAGQNHKGISGPVFAAKMKRQVLELGCMFHYANAQKLDDINSNECCVTLADRYGVPSQVFGNILVIATGVSWRKLDVPGVKDQLNKTFHYGPYHAIRVSKGGVYTVIGGGNSSGQAIIKLAEHAKMVNVIARSGLNKMSRYLIDRIANAPNVNVLEGVTPIAVQKDGLRISNGDLIESDHIYFAGGMVPNTHFLQKDKVELDSQGFVITGKNQFSLQTTRPDVFAVGDVRANVLRKSVGNAIADANEVISEIFQYLGNSTPKSANNE